MTIFRELQLRIPGSPNSRRAQFNSETRCTAALIERLLPRIVTEGVWKAVFGCVNEIDEPGFVSTAGGVYELQVSADPDGFFPLDDQGKKEWTLLTLERGMARLLPLVGWPPEPFEQAFAGARALGLRNEWVWRKPKASSARKHTAEIVVHHDIRACDISLVIRDRSGKELRRALLVSSPPSEFFFYYHLGALKWFSETRVGLINRDGDQQWTVDV